MLGALRGARGRRHGIRILSSLDGNLSIRLFEFGHHAHVASSAAESPPPITARGLFLGCGFVACEMTTAIWLTEIWERHRHKPHKR